MVRKLVESKLTLTGIAVAVIFTVVGALLLHASAQAGKGVGGTTTASSAATSTATPSGQTIFIATSTPSASSTGTPSSSGTPTGQGGYPGGPGGPGAPPSGTPSPGAVPTPGTTGGTPTLTPTAPSATPTASPALPYDFAVVAPLTPVASTTYDEVYVTIKNTGTNAWNDGTDGSGLSIACISFCPTATEWTHNATVPPGGTRQYIIDLGLPGPWTSATYHSIWQISRLIYPSTSIPFGPTIDLAITRTSAIMRDDQAAPSCANPSGVAWSRVNDGGGNSFACGGSYLSMRQASLAAPMAVLTAAPGNYTGDGLRAKVHIHFANMGTDAFAGFGIHVPTSAGQCPYDRFEIRPDGTWRITSVMGNDCHDVTSASGSVGPATDYDLWLNLGYQFFVNGNVVVNGGLQGTDGRLSLSVKSPSGNSGDVRFSNFQYAEVVNTPDTFRASAS